MLRRMAASVAAGVLLFGSTSAFAVGGVSSISIVDAPRPQPKWGFAPGTRKIAPGTWVTWSNDGQDPHTVTAVDGSFDSGDLEPSEGFSWFFDQPGRFAYVCGLHPWMTGTIVVGDGAPVQSEQPAASVAAPQPSAVDSAGAGDPAPAPGDDALPSD